MSPQKHQIGRQIFEIQVPNRALAARLHQELGALSRRSLEPLVDRMCTQLSAPDRVHRIGRLEVDIGELDAENLERDLLGRLIPALQAALAARIREAEQEATALGEDPETSARLELISLFARTGTVPFWAEASNPRLIDEALSWSLAKDAAETCALVRSLARDRRSLLRLSLHIETDRLLQLFRALLSQRSRAPAEVPAADLWDLLAASRAAAPKVPAGAVRVGVLQAACLGEMRDGARTDFWREALGYVAIEAAVPYRALLGELGRVVRRASELGAVLRALSAELPEAGKAIEVVSDTPANADKTPRDEHARPNSPVGVLQRSDDAIIHNRTDISRVEGTATHENSAVPHGGDAVPHGGDAVPHGGDAVPHGGDAVPHSSNAIPRGSNATPHDKSAIPHSSRGIPHSGDVVSRSDIYIPRDVNTTWSDESSIQRDQNTILRDQRAIPRDSRAPVRGPGASLPSTPTAARARPRPPAPPPPSRQSDPGEAYVDNAGLVLLWPFLGLFFERLGLMARRRFLDPPSVHRAVGLLHHAGSLSRDLPEYQLTLSKILCGMPLAEPFDFGPPMTDAEFEECGALLSAVLARAPELGNIDAAALRDTFLLRKGVLRMRGEVFSLSVEHAPHDLVLQRLPWPLAWVRNPWMQAPLCVEWLP